jgi:hypothetical protein
MDDGSKMDIENSNRTVLVDACLYLSLCMCVHESVRLTKAS